MHYISSLSRPSKTKKINNPTRPPFRHIIHSIHIYLDICMYIIILLLKCIYYTDVFDIKSVNNMASILHALLA